MRHLTRRRAAGVAVVLSVVLPLGAFLLAPGAQADDSPGANLGGLNATAYGSAIQFIPLVTGLVPAGNLATGNFFQVSVPYSSASSQTGPSTSATSTPVYPGPVATSLSGALQEFGFPTKLALLFTDPVLAQAAYPPEPGIGSSGSYSPPSGSTTGAGTAQASAKGGGSSSQAALTNTPLAGGLITIGSSTTDSSTTVGASSVSDVAHAGLSHISIMGLVDIASISSQSTASSDGSNGKQTSDLKIGAVTVAGQPAYIGPDGLHLSSTSNNLGGLNQTLNSALSALQQAGITITTVSPSSSVQGPSASVDSGAVQIHFVDQNIPSPQGRVPVTSAGVEIDLGLTHADATATALPPFTPSSGSATLPGAVPPSSGVPTATNTSTGGVGAAVSQASPGFAVQPTTASQPTSSGGSPAGVALPAAFLGMPTRMAWVVIAIIISIIASAPLLGYANWQLLRGRKS